MQDIVEKIRMEERNKWKAKYPEWKNRKYVNCGICGKRYLTQPKWREICYWCRTKKRLTVEHDK